MAVSKRTRFEVFKRDRFTCQYCGRRPPDVVLEADHIMPKCEGGEDTIDNLTTACLPCNRGKSGVPLDNVAPALDEMEYLATMQEMLERKLTLTRTTTTLKAAAKAEKKAIKMIREWWEEGIGSTNAVQDASLRKFLTMLPLEKIREAVDATAILYDRRPNKEGWQLWTYFCGVCWKMIRSEEGAN